MAEFQERLLFRADGIFGRDTGEIGSRGLEFLMNKNRIDVAVSRAQSLAVVVGNPRLALTACGSGKDPFFVPT